MAVSFRLSRNKISKKEKKKMRVAEMRMFHGFVVILGMTKKEMMIF
uniref:Uncharacterized protein n=1 Tax=Rhizophora mucronata TaxID=61149 RepID=A0A2P2PKK7_RHIMU